MPLVTHTFCRDLSTPHEPLGVTYENAPPKTNNKMEDTSQDDFFNLPPIRRANKEANDPEVTFISADIRRLKTELNLTGPSRRQCESQAQSV